VPTLTRPRSRSVASRRATVVSNGASDPESQQDLVSRAYDELLSLIVWGQLPPGARIAERMVAERLGYSRTPVRSALHRLQQEGFIASSGRGRDQRLIVSPVTQEDGRELFTIVGHLEGLAARLAASLPPGRRREIAARMRELNGAIAVAARQAKDPSVVFSLDLAFHHAYVEGVVGPRLLALHRAIKPQCERYARLYVTVLVVDLSATVKEHEVITRAIARGEVASAQLAAETNWHNAGTRLSRIIAQYGERGSWHVNGARPRQAGLVTSP
jgi:DNA-binding GntR family transcriptional regulator